jgi:hypothetical protein
MRRPPSCGALRKAARSPYGARRYTGANASVGTAPSEAAGWQSLTQGVRVRGCWSTLDTYLPGDVVRLNGSAWIASATSTGSTPPLVSTDWQLLAQGDPHPASPSSQTYVFGKKGSVTVQDANVTASSAIVIQYVNGAGAPTSVDDVPAGQFTASESSGKSFEYVVYLRRIRIEKRGPRHPWRCPASSSSVYFGARAAPAVRSRLRCDQILTRPSALWPSSGRAKLASSRRASARTGTRPERLRKTSDWCPAGKRPSSATSVGHAVAVVDAVAAAARASAAYSAASAKRPTAGHRCGESATCSADYVGRAASRTAA